MINYFRSKEYRMVYSLLDNANFYNDKFNNFNITEVTTHFRKNPSYISICFILMSEVKLSPLKILKIIILSHQILQVCGNFQQDQKFISFLQKLHIRSKNLKHYFSQQKKETDLNESEQKIQSSSDLIRNKNQYTLAGGKEYYFLQRIIQPFILLQQKVILNFDTVYHLQQLEEENIWVVVNLIKKFTEFAVDFEYIGRYFFTDFASGIVCLIKVIDYDLQRLYRRLTRYIRHQIVLIEEQVKRSHLNGINKFESREVDDMLLLCDELQAVNQNIRLVYQGKYFHKYLVAYDIYLPSIITPDDQQFDILYDIKKKMKKIKNKDGFFKRMTNIQQI